MSLLPAETKVEPSIEAAGPAVATASPTELTAPSPPRAAEDTSVYAQVLVGLIESHLEYPLRARKLHWEGRCLIRCHVQRSGAIEQAVIVSPSEHELLDKEALRSIQRIGAFPPVPESVQGAVVAIEVPITFHMRE